MELKFNIYWKYDKIGRIEVKDYKIVKNEWYTSDRCLRLYAKVTDYGVLFNLLQRRIMPRHRWTKEFLDEVGEPEYNVYRLLYKTHGLDVADYMWFEFDGQHLNYDDIKVRD